MDRILLSSADKPHGDAGLLPQQDLSPAHTASTGCESEDPGVPELDPRAGLTPTFFSGYQEDASADSCYQSHLGLLERLRRATPHYCSSPCNGSCNSGVFHFPNTSAFVLS